MTSHPAWYTGDPAVDNAISAALGTAESGPIAIAIAAAKVKAINAQVGTTYAAVLTDAGKIVTLSNASAITMTLPKDVTAAIAIGATIDFYQIGAGLVTFAAESGATIHKVIATLKTLGQYSKVTATKIAANTWQLNGDLSAT